MVLSERLPPTCGISIIKDVEPRFIVHAVLGPSDFASQAHYTPGRLDQMPAASLATSLILPLFSYQHLDIRQGWSGALELLSTMAITALIPSLLVLASESSTWLASLTTSIPSRPALALPLSLVIAMILTGIVLVRDPFSQRAFLTPTASTASTAIIAATSSTTATSAAACSSWIIKFRLFHPRRTRQGGWGAIARD